MHGVAHNVCADDVVLLCWTSARLQLRLDSMHSLCQALGLTISLCKTELVVFNGTASGTWHAGQHVLPQSASFKYLGRIFHEAGSMSPASAKLTQSGKDAAVRLSANNRVIMCSKSSIMMRRLLDAVVRPTVSYGCKVQAPNEVKFLCLSLPPRMSGCKLS